MQNPRRLPLIWLLVGAFICAIACSALMLTPHRKDTTCTADPLTCLIYGADDISPRYDCGDGPVGNPFNPPPNCVRITRVPPVWEE